MQRSTGSVKNARTGLTHWAHVVKGVLLVDPQRWSLQKGLGGWSFRQYPYSSIVLSFTYSCPLFHPSLNTCALEFPAAQAL